jgi:CBS domain-containing protein
MTAAERLGDLDGMTVADVMRAGLVSCPDATPLADVADAMVAHRVHAVFVPAVRDDPVYGNVVEWGLVTDLDVARAVARRSDAVTAGELARGGASVVRRDAGLRHAAELMAEHAVTHLVVAEGLVPEGVVSALDIARAVAAARDVRNGTAPNYRPAV